MLEDLPASGRLAGGRGLAVTATWGRVITWREMIRMRADLTLPTRPAGSPAGPMPVAGQVIASLGLWQRRQAAEVPERPSAGTLW